MHEDDEHSPDRQSLKDPTRILALTDGVFAIIMTLLILEVKLPSSSVMMLMQEQLKATGYLLFLYCMSFLLAGVYWVSHRFIFSHVRYVNNTLVWLNIIFLMICSLIPFAANLLGNFPHDFYALFFYGILLTLLAGWRLYLFVYVSKQHHLMHAPMLHVRKKRILRVMIFAPVMFFMSLCLVASWPTLSLILYAITPPCFVAAITIADKLPVHRDEK